MDTPPGDETKQPTTRISSSPSRPTALLTRGFRLELVSAPEGATPGEVYKFSGGRCTIGSLPGCSIRIDDETVSRFHCEIEVDDRGARIRDLDSSNGTLVDGTGVIEGFLKSGSLVRIGRTTLRFSLAGTRGSLPLSSRTDFGELIGHSVAMRALFALLEKIAPTDSKVLLEGETGTGKSLTARSIHLQSRRASGPFIKVDCGAIPATLLESELFGHVKGAFTGAHTSRVGAFAAAHQGTLFLDEIGELPLELQPKLLDVLESQVVHRIGDDRRHVQPADARIIAATNRDLRTEVNAGRFREDLYYRLAVAPIRIPALRQRPEDIPLLAQALLRRLDVHDERIAELLASEFMGELRAAAWPGNIRQFANYLERWVVFDVMEPPDEPLDVSRAPQLRATVDVSRPYYEVRDEIGAAFERFYVRELLRVHGGNVTRAARAGGVHRSYLYKLMQRHGINERSEEP